LTKTLAKKKLPLSHDMRTTVIYFMLEQMVNNRGEKKKCKTWNEFHSSRSNNFYNIIL